jgi:hypothetical protein
MAFALCSLLARFPFTRLTQGRERQRKIRDEPTIDPREEPGQLLRNHSARMLGEHRPNGFGLRRGAVRLNFGSKSVLGVALPKAGDRS